MIEYLYPGVGGEIFTPIEITQDVLNLVPLSVWQNKSSKVIDIGVKSGIFLKLAHAKFMEGLSEEIPNEIERSEYILKNSIYGIAINKAFEAISKTELYGSYKIDGNIISVEKYTGRIKSKDLGSIIEKGFGKDMHFDVIVGNPPYQESTGGGKDSGMTMPLYNKFIDCAIESKPRYIAMIIPSRWMSGGKSVLDDLRRTMIEGKHLVKVVNYQKASDIFDSVDIAGGVQYFLWDSQYTGDTEVINKESGKEDIVNTRDLSKYTYKNKGKKEQYMIIIDNTSAKIADKVISFGGVRMDGTVIQIRPFGLGSDFEDSLWETAEKPIRVVCSGGRETWTDLENITQNKKVVGKWKVCVGKVTGFTDPKQSKGGGGTQ